MVKWFNRKRNEITSPPLPRQQTTPETLLNNVSQPPSRRKVNLQPSTNIVQPPLNPRHHANNVQQPLIHQKLTLQLPTNKVQQRSFHQTDNLQPASNTDNHIPLSHQLQTIMNLPVFGGRPQESFTMFINELEQKMPDNLNEKQKMEIMVLRLHGNASTQMVKYASSNSQLQWNSTINALQQQFPEPTATTYQTIKKRKQKEDETLEEYAADIRLLVNKFFSNNNGYNQTSREHQMVKFFVSNATPLLKHHLLKQKSYNKLNDVLNDAVQFQVAAITSKSTDADHKNVKEIRRGPS